MESCFVETAIVFPDSVKETQIIFVVTITKYMIVKQKLNLNLELKNQYPHPPFQSLGLPFIDFFLFFLFFEDRVSCSPGWYQILYVTEGDLELLILLPLPPKGLQTYTNLSDLSFTDCLNIAVVLFSSHMNYIITLLMSAAISM